MMRKWKRKASENNIVEKFTQKEWKNKLKKSKGICLNCNKNIGIKKLQLDHIYPVFLASKDYLKTNIKRIYTIKDVQPLCKSCNSGKRDRIK